MSYDSESFRCSLRKVRDLEMGTSALKSKREDSCVPHKPSLECREHSGLEASDGLGLWVPGVDERPVGVPQAFQSLSTLGDEGPRCSLFPRTQT